MTEKEILSNKINTFTGISSKAARMKIITDTSDWMRINPGDVLRIGGKDYAIRGNVREPRFGIDDQPKYWVFSAIDLDNGSEKIIKTVFNEEFHAHIGILRIRCYRSPEKEGKVLDFVRDDLRFMQGITEYDDKDNNVRIIDYIRGKSFFKYIPGIEKTHEQYYFEDLPEILFKLYNSLLAICRLHDDGFCHGDIRSDHIIIESGSGNYKWIDFDLMQDVSDFDLWCFGNMICYAASKGIVTYERVFKGNEFSREIKASLSANDGSAFYNYRIINLKKLYPYISDNLNNLLMHFSTKPVAYFGSMNEFRETFYHLINTEFRN